jgi:poly[(R)-3-hydroxyalkanoate] polymerase subunit PhaC
MNKQQTLIDQVLSERPEPTVALNPLTGLHLDDLKEIFSRTALQGARQPLILGKHLSSHARKLVDILARRAEYAPDRSDSRFRDHSWTENGGYQRLMQSYLALNQSLEEWVDDLELDPVDRLRADFLLRMIGDSIAPTNTLLGNPQALRKARETRGKSLLRGMKNLVSDLRDNHGIPSQVKGGSFVLGENIATSPGAVVFRNEVLELIQYAPATERVHRRPLLMVSAMINKFYALDLSPERSFIKFCVDSGLQVFVVSWANPRIENAAWGIERYALAVMEAITAVKSISRCKDLNLFSLCSGAMMTSAMAAYLKARGDNSIHSMTIGVCMLEMMQHDMELGAFANEEVFERVKRRSNKAGILRGHELALSMLWLRPQELIWGNVVNNYLLGNEPPEFDLLYWNNDWTNLPAQLHADVIDMFSTACLSTPGEMSIEGTALDLQALDCDKFFLGGLSDHITPWKACYRSARAFGGRKEFLLSNSGHMQTMLNSPQKKNASYFTNGQLPAAADAWLTQAQLQHGSWWEYWWDWVQPRSLIQKNAPRQLGNKAYTPGAAAPGDYARQQSE